MPGLKGWKVALKCVRLRKEIVIVVVVGREGRVVVIVMVLGVDIDLFTPTLVVYCSD